MTDLIGREDERLEVSVRLRRSRLVTLTGLGGIGAVVLGSLGALARLAGDFASARASSDESLRSLLELHEKGDLRVCLEERAALLRDLSKIEDAARLLGAAHRLRENLGTPASPNTRAKIDPVIRHARATLSAGAFVAAWEEGREMTWARP
jgi:hypothetical protein